MKAILLQPTRWVCLSCDLTHVSPQTPLHQCKGLAGLVTAMVPEGTVGVHVVREREDYILAEDVQFDGNGRPVMSVETHRDEGVDATVYVPRAVAKVRE